MSIMVWPLWLWNWTCSVAQCLGIVIVVRHCLVPWTFWLGRHVLCWSWYALSAMTDGRCDGYRSYRETRDRSTCRCCGGIDFDGMVGRWAVVTGCTDGIGKEYALQLSDRGMNVALVSRNVKKLLTMAKEIDERHAGAVRTRTVTADFTSSGVDGADGGGRLSATYDAVRTELSGLDVAVLINNAGAAYARPERLLDLPACCSGATGASDTCRDIVECNALATVAMCRAVMPLMMDAATGGRGQGQDEHGGSPPGPRTIKHHRGGVVVNVSSGFGRFPCPMLTVYGATKAFMNKFSEDLQVEYSEDSDRDPQGCPPIAVRCLTPGLIATKMTRVRPTGSSDSGLTFVPSAATYVRHSLRSLDCHCGCRPARRLKRNGGSGGSDVGRVGASKDSIESKEGWLAGVASAVFVSPFSPFTPGSDGATPGYLFHTIVIRLSYMIMYLLGDRIMSKIMAWSFCKQRDRMVILENKKKAHTEGPRIDTVSGDKIDVEENHVTQSLQKCL